MNLRNLITLILLILSSFSLKVSYASNLVVEHVANAGVKITADNQTVLIDALHSPAQLSSQADKTALKELSSTSANILLVTNAKSEHFSPKLVSSFMLHNPDAILIGAPKVVHRMHNMFNKNRTISPNLNSFESVRYQYQDITVTAMNTASSNTNDHQKHNQHYAFLVEVGDFNVLHTGEAEITHTIHSLAKSSARRIDLALIPNVCIQDERCVDALTQVDIKNIAITHLGDDTPNKAISSIPALLSNAKLLTKTHNRIELSPLADNIDVSLSTAFQRLQ
jgi:L-ascorbate metabolism protein UlaG (beta-lactamase superfamily)